MRKSYVHIPSLLWCSQRGTSPELVPMLKETEWPGWYRWADRAGSRTPDKFQSSQVLITAFQSRLQPFGKSLIFKISKDIKMCLAYLPMAQTGVPDRSLRRAGDGLLRQEHSPDLAWCQWDELNSGRVAPATPVGCPALCLAQAGGIISWLSGVLMFLCKCSQSKNLKGKKIERLYPLWDKSKVHNNSTPSLSQFKHSFFPAQTLGQKALPDPLMNRAGGRFNHSIQNQHFGFLLFDFEPWLFFS